MSVKYYELCQNLYKEFEMSEQKIREGKTKNARNSLSLMKIRYT